MICSNSLINSTHKLLLTFNEDPILCLIRLISLTYKIKLLMKKNVKLGMKLNLKGIPIIECINDGYLNIGSNVTLYSTKRQYFSCISTPVRLFMEDGGRIIIGDNTRINGATIHSRKFVTVGKNCLIASNTSILDSNGHKINMDNPKNRLFTRDNAKPIIIKDNVWIGMNCIILKGVTVGTGSVIGAGCVVKTDIPPFSIVEKNDINILKCYKTI